MPLYHLRQDGHGRHQAAIIQGQQSGHTPAEPSWSEVESNVLSKQSLDNSSCCAHTDPGATTSLGCARLPALTPINSPPCPTQSAAPYLANIRRSSGFWAAGTLRIAARSCSERLASRFSVIRLFSGESPLGSSSALELSILGLVRVMSSLLAVDWNRPAGFQCTKMEAPKALQTLESIQILRSLPHSPPNVQSAFMQELTAIPPPKCLCVAKLEYKEPPYRSSFKDPECTLHTHHTPGRNGGLVPPQPTWRLKH